MIYYYLISELLLMYFCGILKTMTEIDVVEFYFSTSPLLFSNFEMAGFYINM